ncbi:MAG: rRNA maturation RNase YbeY [Clostridiales bacterium]|nr:rRNA maturation RNase YbeY [Clostridiales bacterium]
MVVKIEIFNNSSYSIELDDFKKYFLSIMKDLQVEDALVNIIIVDNEEIKKINKEYRNIDNVTDVISFALEDVEFKTPFRILGDIYNSYEKVKEQALKYEHSEKRELYFLATHGLLHLLGYDHMNEKEEKIMFDLQKELLDKYDIKR